MKKLLIPILGGSLLLAASTAQAAAPLLNPCNVLHWPMYSGVNIADAVGTCNDNAAVVEVLINDTAYYYENFEQATSTHGILTVTGPLNPTGAIDGWYNESDSNPVEGALAVAYSAPGHNHAYAKSLFGGAYPDYNPDPGIDEYRSLSFAASARSQWVDILTFDANGSYTATFTVDGLAGGLAGSFTTWSWPSPYESTRSWDFNVTVLGLDDPVHATLSMGQSGEGLTGSFDESGTLSFDYVAGNDYLIVASLQVGVSNGGSVDFYNTATLSGLTLTPGTTMSALSGTDYFNLGSTVAPAIPEPGTHALMLAGLGLVGWAARRRTREQSSAPLDAGPAPASSFPDRHAVRIRPLPGRILMRIRNGLILLLLCLAALGVQAGQMYRWVDEKGVVQYSDQPPPPKARKAETIKPRANVVEADKEGFEMRRARETNPVLLYVTDCGEPCDLARDFLAQRKIPYSRKNPQNVPEDAVELKQLAGALEVPVIKVGGKHLKGFDPAAWEGLLSAAGYPVRVETTRP